jgi:hypothetical protein
MANKKKGQSVKASQWWVHLRPFWKREFWKRQRQADKKEIDKGVKDKGVG